MYNLWFIVIVLAIIEIVLIVLEKKEIFELGYDFLPSLVFSLITIALVVLIVVAIVNPIVATNKVGALLAERDTLQILFENREDLDKSYITERVVEYNKEVARIIGSAKSLGNWSAYAFTDYELLTFIEI